MCHNKQHCNDRDKKEDRQHCGELERVQDLTEYGLENGNSGLKEGNPVRRRSPDKKCAMVKMPSVVTGKRTGG
jgi:hypothetical protein